MTYVLLRLSDTYKNETKGAYKQASIFDELSFIYRIKKG